jgi:AraC family transcriptional activator of pobA
MTGIPLNALPPEEQLMHITPFGDDMPYDFKRPHRHDYFEFFLFTAGGGIHYIDFAGHPIVAESVHVIFPSQIHLLKRAGARGFIIICRKEYVSALPKLFYTQLFQNNYAAPCISFSPESFEGLMRIFTSLQSELEEKHMLARELVNNYMALFLGHCIRESGRTPVVQAHGQSPHHLDVYRQFLLLLETHFDARHPVSFYAGQLSVTAKTLNNCVRGITGRTTIELIQERTLTEAKRLLLFTAESSKEIAWSLAFKDASYFTRFFKKLEGVTPGEFKAHWEEKYHS